MKDVRDAFFDEIYRHAKSDEKFVVVTNDMDVHSLRSLARERPDQLVNAGVAEQNMINVAAGLCSTGHKVLVFGISSFMVFRAYEQIRLNVAGMGLPVVMVGIGQGFSFSYDGPTHHGIADLAVLRTIPELTIVNIGDTVVAEESARQVLKTEVPIFVRLDKGPYPAVHQSPLNYDLGFSVIKEVADVTVITSGSLLPMTNEVVNELTSEGLDVGLIDVFRASPFPGELSKMLKTAKFLIVVEENTSIGGIFSSLIHSEQFTKLTVHHLGNGLSERQHYEFGERTWLLESNGLGRKDLRNKILALTSDSK